MRKDIVFFKKLISMEEALKIVLENVIPIKKSRYVKLEDAVDLVCAEDVISEMNVPPFRRSAMDGYAVIAEDTFRASNMNAVELKIVGKIHAGEKGNIEFGHGECVEIATGAPLPPSGDAVVMAEYTEKTRDVVKIYKGVHPGENVSEEGSDIKKGDLVVKKGVVFTPGRVGGVTAIGRNEVRVLEKPRVAIIPTGDEIMAPGEKLKDGKIYDVNTYTLCAVVKNYYCEPVIYKRVPDDLNEIEKALEKSLECDCAIFSGASSVGVRDLLVDIIENKGKILFHGVKVKPGKPFLFGIVDGTPVFGLPGYPTSCLNVAYVFLRSALLKMSGRKKLHSNKIKLKMRRRVASTLGRSQFLTVQIDEDYAVPSFKESGAITSISEADGYIIIPENKEVVEKDEEVEVYLFE